MISFISLVALTDGYKLGHRPQYAPGTEFVLSNFTARSARDESFKKCIFLGLQGFLQEFFMEEAKKFFNSDIRDVVEDYEASLTEYFGPAVAKSIGSDHIAALHRLGYIPLLFKALPEGTAVPLQVPMFTAQNTDKDFFWVVNYFETLISSYVWKISRNATVARRYRQIFDKYAKLTGGDPAFVDWQGHDFSFRGMSGPEDAIRNIGHLASFLGSDTFPTIKYLKRYYDATGIIAMSVPATEHSVMCSGGKESEQETISRIMDLYPTGTHSQVMDTWDLWKVIDEYLPNLKDKIMARDGKLVVRPDSGDPELILCGDPAYPLGSTPRNGVIKTLWNNFGGTQVKGLKGEFLALDTHIGTIYGDSITTSRADRICSKLMEDGLCSTNWVAGVGSYTYQYTTRDDFGMAVKATWALNNGEDRLLQKDPVTGNRLKKSAKGQMVVLKKSDGEYLMLDGMTSYEASKFEEVDELKPVWWNGRFTKNGRTNWKEVRQRVSEQFV